MQRLQLVVRDRRVDDRNAAQALGCTRDGVHDG